MNKFLERIQSGEILVADGATGTNLQKLGIQPGTPPEELVLDQPDLVLQLEKAFVAAGSDLVLTDLVMPGLNGRDLATRLLEGRPTLRVLLMSGYDPTLADSKVDEQFRLLAKPFGADELARVVRTALSEPQAQSPSVAARST